MRGFRMLAPPATPRKMLVLTCDSELMERGELLGVVEVKPSEPSRRSLVGEASLSAKDADVNGNGSRAEKRRSFLSQWKS